ncbi:MAG: protein-glutamate O-methyltransferase CheR [Magnetococcales bacterium]|nr:protein-glutamate O-methyltransferase CheR [Magnetococcales bacterium]
MNLDPEPFKILIRNRCGLCFETANEENLLHALNERMQSLGMGPDGYFVRLNASETEFQQLVNRLTINETYFFREPEQIRLLVEHLVPRLLARGSGLQPLRILSVGCSSGEEPYSLVMALMERYGESVSRLFTFAACDIDSAVLDKARRGCYSEFSFRSLSPELRARYFRQENGGWCLEERIRRLVDFQECNLLSEEPARVMRGVDVLFFRNVSIYFDPPTRRLVLDRLAAMLQPEGILIVGASETLANDLGVLHLLEEAGLFYFVRNPLVRDPVAPLPWPGRDCSLPMTEPEAPSPALVSPARLPDADFDVQQAQQLVQEKRHDEALRLLDTYLAIAPEHAGAMLIKAHLLVWRKEFAAAEALARRVLESDSRSIDALVLLGLLAKWRQQNDVAIDWFKQAVYWCHHCWPAHYYLADIYRSGNEIERALHSYRVVMQLLNDGTTETGLHHLALGLPVAEIRFLCEHQLSRLGMPTGRGAAARQSWPST